MWQLRSCAAFSRHDEILLHLHRSPQLTVGLRYAQKVEFPSNVASFYIANVVMSADLKFKVRLEGLARLHSRFCTVRGPVMISISKTVDLTTLLHADSMSQSYFQV